MKNITKKLIFVFVLVAFFGVGASFASASAPTVSTTGQSSTVSSITFNGNFMANGSQTTTMFEYSANQNDLPNNQAGNGMIVCQNLQPAAPGSGSFTCTVSTPTITAGVTYYFRAIASNVNGGTVNSTYGTISSVSTSNNPNPNPNPNPSGGGGGSGGCGLNPTISSLSPSSAVVGSGTIYVVISGNNFDNTSVPRFNGYTRSIFGSIYQNQITMILTPSDLASAGTETITIANNGCSSSGAVFTVTNSNPTPGAFGTGLNYPVSVTTQSATNVGSNSAVFNGSVNPNGYTTTAWFEYGTGSTLASFNETTHTAEGAANGSSSLVQSTTGLNPNTTYYFRAVANNSYGTVKGNISSFTTGTLNSAITTVQATNQTSTSARLNGVFINQNGNSSQGYFEYGSTASLGSLTSIKALGSSSSVSFSDTISNLAPGTIYYFRAIAVNQGSTLKGNVLVFQTKGASTVPDNTASNNTPSAVTTDQSSVLKITTTADNISVGGDIEYLVTFTNTNSANIENAVISVQLPKEIDFKDSNFGKVDSNNLVTLDAGILVPNQVGSMTIKGALNSNASGKNVIITTAVMTYNLAGSTVEKDEIAYVTNHVTAGTGLEANSLFGASFLPSTLLGWLALLLVLLGLGVVGRKIYADYYMTKAIQKGSADHVDNLPM